MSRSVWWDEENIQQLIFLCGQYSIEASIKNDHSSAADILIKTGRFINFLSICFHIARLPKPTVSDRWLDLKFTNILYAITNAKYSPESERLIILRDINLVINFLDLNNLDLKKLTSNTIELVSTDDEIQELILPEPFDSNDFYY
jgi:hypothetical protein